MLAVSPLPEPCILSHSPVLAVGSLVREILCCTNMLFRCESTSFLFRYGRAGNGITMGTLCSYTRQVFCFYSKLSLFLLEVESVSTRSRVCFYSKQSLFLLEAEPVSTRIRVLLNPKDTAIPLKTQHGSTPDVQRLGWNHAVTKGNTFVYKATMAMWKEWGGREKRTCCLLVRQVVAVG